MPDTPTGPKAPKVTSNALRVGVEIDMSGLRDRLYREALRLLQNLTSQGLPADEIADRMSGALMDLSDRPIQDAARGATSESFNLGRNLAAQSSVDAIQTVVRTEVLDGNTCEPCRAVDGEVVELNSDDYFRLMPPNLCEGRELCRGFYIYLTGEVPNA